MKWSQLMTWKNVKTCVWVLYDGVGFFVPSDLKLDRLRGIKAKWTDKCTSARWMLMYTILLICITIILADQIKMLGEVKSQEVLHVYQKVHRFEVRDQLNLFAMVYFPWNDFIEKLNRNREEKLPSKMVDMSEE